MNTKILSLLAAVLLFATAHEVLAQTQTPQSVSASSQQQLLSDGQLECTGVADRALSGCAAFGNPHGLDLSACCGCRPTWTWAAWI
jgi:hypothetical protein